MNAMILRGNNNLDSKGTYMEPGHATIANKNKNIKKPVCGKVLG